MSRDAVCAGGLTLQRSCDRIGFARREPAIARLAHRGYVVDINAEF